MSDVARLIAGLRSEDTSTRTQARKSLSLLPPAESVEPLAALARDAGAPADSRADALDCLAGCGAAAKAPAAALLGDAEPKVRAAALQALAELDRAALGARLPDLMNDPSPLVRLYAVRESAAAPDRAGLLRAALADPSSAVRRQTLIQITELPSKKGWPAELARAFARTDARPEAEFGGAGNRLSEEQSALFALVCCAAEPDLTRETARLAPRLIELAGDPDAYDPDAHVEAGRFAAELLAAAGAPREFTPGLEALLEKGDLYLHIRKQAILALVRSAPDAAVEILSSALVRAGEGRSRLPLDAIADGLDRARRRLGK